MKLERKRSPSDCDNKCPWQQSHTKPGTYRCEAHGGRFPCKERYCGHSDCLDVRGGLALCFVCKKDIEGEKTRTVKLGKARWAHMECA